MTKKSKLNHTKAISWASLPWSKVNVHDDRQRENRENDANYQPSNNHYDNPGKIDPSDLYDVNSTNGPDYVEGANEPGIFLGLEVIDGSQYSVEKIPVVNPVTKEGTGGFVTKLVVKEAVVNSTQIPPPNVEVEAKKKQGEVSRKRKRSLTDGHQQKKKKKNSELTHHVTQEEMETIREAWSNATGGVCLHPKLCRSLHRLGFSSPTPIQSSTLAASILGQRDIVGAAPTGSGKTLSYLLPILHALLTEEDEQENGPIRQYPLRALILCPTRELAMQVSMEFSKLIKTTLDGDDNDLSTQSVIKCGTIVGGLAEQKQKRVLDVKRPPVLVATPGRLWDLMSSGDHCHLENLKQLQFLVVDEADRMISQGSFPQLERILEKIQRANPSLEYLAAHAEEQDDSDSDNDGRLRSLPGIRGEAKVQMLDENILEMIERQRGGINAVPGENPTSEEADDLEVDDEEFEVEAQDHVESSDDETDENEKDVPVKRQTFVFSATLTLPSCSLKRERSRDNRLNNRKKGKQSVDGAIADIMEKIGAQGIAKVVDLSTSETSSNNTSPMQRQNNDLRLVNLPAGLSLFEIRCTQKHKDSHLYSFLTTTKQGSSGPCLVFCNSISGVKRIFETLKVLKLPVRMLHSQMQQKARLSSLESLAGSNSRSVVIATDVAARGLDIPAVSTVVHYDVARAVDTFVHRAGRTARGVGAKAVGWSVSLVSASEEKSHQIICRAVRGEGVNSFAAAPIDGRLLANAQERVNLASKIVACEHVESRTKKNNQWFVEAAKDAEIELDSELLEDGQLEGSKKERQQYLDAKRARHELNILLSKPIRKQMFGKFLSNAGLRDSFETENDIKPYVTPNAFNGSRRSKQKRNKGKVSNL